MRNQSGWCISMLKCPEKWFPVIKNTWNNQRLTRNKNMVCDIMTMRLNIRSNSYSLTKNHQKWLLPFDMVRLFVFVLWSTRLFLLYDEYSFTRMNNVCVSGILEAKDEKTNDLVKFDPFMFFFFQNLSREFESRMYLKAEITGLVKREKRWDKDTQTVVVFFLFWWENTYCNRSKMTLVHFYFVRF